MPAICYGGVFLCVNILLVCIELPLSEIELSRRFTTSSTLTRIENDDGGGLLLDQC